MVVPENKSRPRRGPMTPEERRHLEERAAKGDNLAGLLLTAPQGAQAGEPTDEQIDEVCASIHNYHQSPKAYDRAIARAALRAFTTPSQAEPTSMQLKGPRIAAVLMATELAQTLAADGEGDPHAKRKFGHDTSALLKRWATEYMGSATPSPEKTARMLTEGELEAACGRFHSPARVRAAIRKFCEVNAGCRIPESGKLEGGE